MNKNITRNHYFIGIMSAAISGIAYFLVKYMLSGELDFVSSAIFTIFFGTSFILTSKFFKNK